MSSAANEPEIDNLRREIKALHDTLREKEQRLLELEAKAQRLDVKHEHGLTNDDIARYSRQLILPNFGVNGQLKLKQSGFLIVGMGGLGCPAAQYLLAAGCGRIGLVDYDTVERSNFHRQTLHTEARVGMTKVESARIALQEINPKCQVDCHIDLLDSINALAIIDAYDVVLDCTDNVATRYLLNDACVKLRKPLISGSALQMDGQLTVYNYGETGPCYRCIFPVPPPPNTVTNCGDGGVLGAITGTIGALQALEAIKVAIGLGDVLAGRLLIFDGNRCVFRNIKIRSKRLDCAVCSAKPLITDLIDYEQFCGMKASDKDFALDIIVPNERITVHEYKSMQSKPHLLLDVRQPSEFEICKLPKSHNVPLKQLLADKYLTDFKVELENTDLPVFVLCRRGNDSQIAVQHMRNKLPKHSIRDIVGGLHAWHYKVDKNFPIY